MPSGAIEKGTYRVIRAINAITTSGSSEEIVIAGAKRITLMFTRANHGSGSSAFDVDVSLDGTTYVDFAKLIANVANTNAQTKTRVASVTLSADGSTVVAMDLEDDCFYSMKVNAVETTDGTHSALVMLEY